MASGHTQLIHAECSTIESWLRMVTGTRTVDVRGSPPSPTSSSSYAPTAQNDLEARRASSDSVSPADTSAKMKVHDIRPSTKSPAFATRRTTRSTKTSTTAPATRDASTTIVPYHAPNSSIAKMSVADRLRRVLSRPLCKFDLDNGLLYMFWQRGSFGLAKIGYTTLETREKRFKGWQRQCGIDLEDCSDDNGQPVNGDDGEYAGTNPPPIRVRNVRRLESLVHAELKDYRRTQLNCAGCGKTHIEWFDVPVKHAQQVVHKWTTWLMAEERYQNKVGGNLLLSSRTGLEELCKPVEFVQAVQKKRIETGRRGSGSRRPSAGAGRRASVPVSASLSPVPETRRRSARIASQQRKSGTLGALAANPWSGLTVEH
ncbi:uncharacterized protein AB675_10130 [Cyphellophora attinorum]|uniref:Bacteriophage T5 Orf172 DNA-binding domain-containing protein n=1 Tax=Cyphellophora attinorum TaxID=1664694 RepID=A0A0N1HHE7_9EURO|nr:uncharacterized protein AB675_10130 [Phialophora attinorum]KPI35172.1 hypothetical protein AB675_10130 [Phialophora attinorum]